jgi:hypothetical protein
MGSSLTVPINNLLDWITLLLLNSACFICMTFEALTKVKMSMLVFWIVMVCVLECRYEGFGETLHLLG